MVGENQNGVVAKSQQSQEQKFCPDCGAQMTEVDRRNEDGALFIWYECSKNNCDRQWLQKIRPET